MLNFCTNNSFKPQLRLTLRVFEKIMSIGHPLAYWVGIRVLLKQKEPNQLNRIHTKLPSIFRKTEGLANAAKIWTELKRVGKRLGVSLE